jgi:hypothetical protein
MSLVGPTIGSPSEGLSRFGGASISLRASSTAFCESGTCTAIWSPSKSALKAEQTSGMDVDRLALHQHRLKGLDTQAVQRRRTVQQTGPVLMTSSSTSQTSGRWRSIMRLAP